MRAFILAALLVAQPAAADDEDEETRSIGSRYFISLGSSIGTRDPVVADTIEDWFTVTLGVPFGKDRQLVLSLEGGDDRIDTMPTYIHHTRTLLGVRLTPLGTEREKAPWFSPTRFIDIKALYVTALAGKESNKTIRYERAERSTYESPALVVGANVGYLPFQGTDWGFGIEFTGRLSRTEQGNEFAYGYGLVAYLMK